VNRPEYSVSPGNIALKVRLRVEPHHPLDRMPNPPNIDTERSFFAVRTQIRDPASTHSRTFQLLSTCDHLLREHDEAFHPRPLQLQQRTRRREVTMSECFLQMDIH